MAPNPHDFKDRLHDLPTPEPESPFPRARKPYRFSTLCATVENPDMKDQYGSSSVPIYQTATFKGVGNEYDYTRSGNPTRTHLQHHLAKISSASHAFTVSSGMAALDVILRILKPGDEVIAGDDLYGGTNRLLTYIRKHVGVVVHHVDTTNPENLHDYIHPTKTAMVLLESPTNPLLKIVDLATISKDVKEIAPAPTCSGRSNMVPISTSADITISWLESSPATETTLPSRSPSRSTLSGNALTPIDSFLLLRGIKTLALRMDRQQQTTQLVAEYLWNLGFHVNYPGLPDHPQREVHLRIADGNGAVLSFETGNKELSEKIVAATRLWVSVHASIDAATRAARGLPEDLIRLCVGIEDPTDLLDDLEHALLDAGAIELNAAQNKLVRVPDPDALSRAVHDLDLNGDQEQLEWFVSAPGKVILFGEHAVVHGVTAVAASVDLRCYGLTTPRTDNKLSVHFSDIDNFYHEWDIQNLPWDSRLVEAITSTALAELGEDKKAARAASLAFLYLYMALAKGDRRPALNFTARSTLPVGAGLGSSASFSTCAAAALSLVHRRLTLPALPAPNVTHTSHQGRRALPHNIAEDVNRLAFMAEKILHGNPSGVDNSVSVFGGALAYTRAGFGRDGGMEGIQGFKSLKFLLTNSKVPRDTKKLVAGVGEKKANEPELVNGILKSIQSISDEARRALADPELPRDALLSALNALIEENHDHLVTLGVSHPALETIREKTKSPFGLSTKLTGAGGGGCAVTLIPDDFKDEDLQSLIDELIRQDYQPYLTSVGGSGLGILSPYPEHRTRGSDPLPPRQDVGQVTPPETPNPEIAEGYEKQAGVFDPLRPPFETAATTDLPGWTAGLGRWLYV
ncbi:hypothetical protein D9611_015012 [Ephemerocybe angulata]|uniref:mevalonate kinase n=1 Tax=Ephemerocybe angulata TaxID=980116 RepID=A0A8H5CAJ5_9AGAR|nr:hypothetical protein D9611_015012 [Tulosesus angulatus]